MPFNGVAATGWPIERSNAGAAPQRGHLATLKAQSSRLTGRGGGGFGLRPGNRAAGPDAPVLHRCQLARTLTPRQAEVEPEQRESDHEDEAPHGGGGGTDDGRGVTGMSQIVPRLLLRFANLCALDRRLGCV